MPHLHIVQDDPGAIHLAHRHGGGLVGIAFGVALAYGVYRFVPPAPGRGVAVGMGIFFAVVGLLSWLWRDGIEIDATARRWRRRRGFAFAPAKTEGGLDALDGISIELEWERERRGSHRVRVPEWDVGLVFERGGRPITFFETKDESEAYRFAKSLAARLHLPLLDRTGSARTRTP